MLEKRFSWLLPTEGKNENPLTKEMIDYNKPPSEEAKEMATSLGGFGLIEKKLKESGLLEKERERVETQYSIFIRPTDFPTKSEALWDILTILDLYDTETMLHSIRTYQIAKEKIEKILSGNIVLGKIIEKEGVDLERFYFACLAHDIGKVEIPDFIIKNKTTKEEWGNKLKNFLEQGKYSKTMLTKLGFEDVQEPTPMEIQDRIEKSRLNAEELLPVKEGLTEEETRRLEGSWGISSEQSLMDIINKHAEYSAEILQRKKFPIIAEIVKNHHHKTTSSYPVSIDSLNISANIADILHLADVEQALRNVRPYKDSFTPLETMRVLVDHAEEGKTGKEITYFWIKDEYNKLDKQKGLLEYRDSEDGKTLNTIKNFMAEFETGKYKDSLEAWMKTHDIKK